MEKYTRRDMVKILGYSTAGLILLSSFKDISINRRKIPSTDEYLPIVGLGTWQTFDVKLSVAMEKQLSEVLSKMKSYGGTLIDSSPMYGRSESVVGELTKKIKSQDHFFYATKVWTSGKEEGIAQMKDSMSKLKRNTIDLMQIHNLVDWKTHIKTLKSWKEEQKIRYWGITHYTDSSHKILEQIIQQEKPDFVQFNYSIDSRHAEKSLLDTARKYRTAVIINRPYNGGRLFRYVKGKKLPSWCAEYDIDSWGQFFLKYLISEEAVTAVIPGTSKPHHLVDNMKAGMGKLPNDEVRKEMIAIVKKF